MCPSQWFMGILVLESVINVLTSDRRTIIPMTWDSYYIYDVHLPVYIVRFVYMCPDQP